MYIHKKLFKWLTCINNHAKIKCGNILEINKKVIEKNKINTIVSNNYENK